MAAEGSRQGVVVARAAVGCNGSSGETKLFITSFSPHYAVMSWYESAIEWYGKRSFFFLTWKGSCCDFVYFQYYVNSMHYYVMFHGSNKINLTVKLLLTTTILWRMMRKYLFVRCLDKTHVNICSTIVMVYSRLCVLIVFLVRKKSF